MRCCCKMRRLDALIFAIFNHGQDAQHYLCGPYLLLVDKIGALAQQGEKMDKKRVTDMEDILFCIQKMYENSEKMPRELKRLYTTAEWNKVLSEFEYVEDGKYYKEVAKGLEMGHKD